MPVCRVFPIATACLLLVSAVLLPTAPAGAQVLNRDGTFEIAGYNLKCGRARNVVDKRMEGEGAASPGVLYFNPRILARHPQVVQLFVFHHECGHQSVGANELKADCYAVNKGVREGWLTRRGVSQVCDTFIDHPETATHPSGKRRCRNLDQCFATALAALEDDRGANDRRREGRNDEPRDDAPRTLRRPTADAGGSGGRADMALREAPALVGIGTLRATAAGIATQPCREPKDPIAGLIESGRPPAKDCQP
jgi:hypothetical protein